MTSPSSFDFSIITPSLNKLPYLKLCCASIADQESVSYEHIVIDGGSTDGTVKWMQSQTGLNSQSEPDRGMYDAINKGLKIAKGEIIAYLNCDEQYLPGTLEAVKRAFAARPDTDILFGGALLVRPDGSLIAYRKAYPIRRLYIMTDHLYLLSCSMFFRRRIVDAGLFFDSTLKTIGDMDFVVRALDANFLGSHISKYLATFTMTGENLSSDAVAIEERFAFQHKAPLLAWYLRRFIAVMRRCEKLVNGAYYQSWPLRYAVYTNEDLTPRKQFSVDGASFLWKTS